MKTLANTQEITTPKMDEIIFEGRNKEYGAYNLRTKYNKHVIWAFLTASSLITTTVATAYMTASRKPDPTTIIHDGVVIMDTPPPPIVLPPPPPPVEGVTRLAVFTPPVFAENVADEPTIGLPGDFTDKNPASPTADPIIDNNSIIPTEEPPAIFPDVAAQFQGGDLETFRVWVLQHLKYPPSAAELKLAGKVTLQFVVNKNGKVENIKILRGVDPILDNEAISVIQSSPKWTPGLIKGRIIRQVFTMPINFQLQE